MTSRESSNEPGAPVADRREVASSRAEEPEPWWPRVLIRVQLFLLVYLLSTGPMYWPIHEAVYFPESAPFVAKLYYPVVFVARYSDTFSDVLDWYVGLWVYGPSDYVELPPLLDEPAVRTVEARPRAG